MNKLCETYDNHFKIGAAVNLDTLSHDKELILRHFNTITVENAMKFENAHPQKNTFNFKELDIIANFAREHNIQMRGHTLVWHNQTPDWVFKNDDGNTDVTREELIKIMKDHIEKVMNRYKDVVVAWDVVNEAIEDKKNHLLRESKWLKIIGEDYIEIAYKHAMKIDPHAQLVYNDYSLIDPNKRKKSRKLIDYLRTNGVKIDAIGIQGHWNIKEPKVEKIKDALEYYKNMNLKIHITELDLSVFTENDRRLDLEKPETGMLEMQAEKYSQLFSLFREYHSVIDSVTFWGVSDYYTWLDNFPGKERSTWPLLFDKNGEPKPSFWEVINFNE